MVRWKMYMVMIPLFSTLLTAEVGFKPFNPEFIKEQEQSKIKKSDLFILKTPVGKKATGWRPSPLQSEIHKSNKSKDKKPSATTTYAPRFDLSDPNLDLNREDSLLTPVKDQGQCGVCWAFASYGAYEGQPKIDHLGTFDFSEQNLRYTNGTEWTNADPCSGGNLPMVTAYLIRGDGPVSETDDPYDLSNGNTYNPEAKAIRYVDNVINLPIRDFNNKMDIDYLKYVLSVLKRPLYVSVQVGFGTAGETGESVWDDSTKSFYCNGDGEICRSNHAVVIVGWDDNYQAQGQTGAFIVRNSWGSRWAGDGYFYVPYNDDSIGLGGSIAYFEDKPENKIAITKIYQHDTLPALYSWGTRDGTSFWGANRYVIEKDGVLNAIGFYGRASNTQYKIRLFKSMTDSSGDVTFSNQIGTTQTGTLSAGWHTVKLNTPVSLSENDTLIVQLELSSPTGYAFALEGDISGYVDAQSAPNESFYSDDGVTFHDLANIGEYNFAIKALVDEEHHTPQQQPSIIPVINYLLW